MLLLERNWFLKQDTSVTFLGMGLLMNVGGIILRKLMFVEINKTEHYWDQLCEKALKQWIERGRNDKKLFNVIDVCMGIDIGIFMLAIRSMQT
jgi:hypothetical protein